MRERWWLMKRAIGFGVTFLAGAVAGFFLAGPILFADGPMGERVATLGAAAVIYLLLGALSGWWLRTWTAGLWLAAPGLVVSLALGEAWPAIGLTMGVLVAGAVAGARVGTHLRKG
jgi:hypothetical protein